MQLILSKKIKQKYDLLFKQILPDHTLWHKERLQVQDMESRSVQFHEAGVDCLPPQVQGLVPLPRCRVEDLGQGGHSSYNCPAARLDPHGQSGSQGIPLASQSPTLSTL